jgi:hypothetical protein
MSELFYVFYHYPCNDGELARVIWEHFEPNSTFYKWQHNNYETEINIINNLPDKSNIVFLDITPINIIEKLSNSHNYIIIDHHKDPMLKLVEKKPNLPNYNILLYSQKGFPNENNFSGCILTWKYFTNEELPSVVHHIGNKDVWDFSDPNTEEYCLGFNHYIKHFTEKRRIDLIKELLMNDKNDFLFMNIGCNLMSEYINQAKEVFNNYSIDKLTEESDSYIIIDIKCSNTALYKYLIEYAQENKENFNDADVLRILHTETDIQKVYSLRSLKDNVKVDKLARHFGGNGHEKAAGYYINQRL